MQVSGSTPKRSHDDAFAALDRLTHQRPHAALAVQLALAVRDDNLGAALGGVQRLAQHLERRAHVVGAGALDPLDADALDGLDDRVIALAVLVGSAGREDVLAAGRRRIAVVDDDGEVVVLVEDRVTDAAGEAVMPEAAVAHDGDRALAAVGTERRGSRSAQPVAHDAVAHVEGRQRRERMAADVRADVQRTELPSAGSSSQRKMAAPGNRCTNRTGAPAPGLRAWLRSRQRRPPCGWQAPRPRRAAAAPTAPGRRRFPCADDPRCIHRTPAGPPCPGCACSGPGGAASGWRPAR